MCLGYRDDLFTLQAMSDGDGERAGSEERLTGVVV